MLPINPIQILTRTTGVLTRAGPEDAHGLVRDRYVHILYRSQTIPAVTAGGQQIPAVRVDPSRHRWGAADPRGERGASQSRSPSKLNGSQTGHFYYVFRANKYIHHIPKNEA